VFTDAAINHYEVEDIVFECVDIAKVDINYYLHVLSLLKLLVILNGLVIFEYAKISLLVEYATISLLVGREGGIDILGGYTSTSSCSEAGRAPLPCAAP
jgi:hypothetical protein